MARPLKQVDPDRSALHWLGHELRRWRTLHGISQKALGAQVGFSRVYISLVETAQERPTRQFVERCDNALATGGRLLALYAHVTAEHAGAWLDIPALRAATQQAELDRHETTRDPVIAVDEDGNVRRDQFLRLAGPAVAGMLAPPLVHGWRDQTARVPSLNDGLLAELRAQTEGLRWLDRKEGSREQLSHAARHAHRVVGLWRMAGKNNPLRVELAAVAADACHLVAYQAFDQGGRGYAIEWYRCAADLAARAGSQDLYVFSVCGVSYMHARSADAAAALAVLQQLDSIELSAASQCYLEVYRGHAYATARQLDAALEALDRAARISERTEQQAPSSWLGIPDGAFVDRQRSVVLAQFGAPQAIAMMQRLDRSTPAVFRRYRVTLATDSALANAHAKSVEESAHDLSRAIVLNRQTKSVDRNQRILHVLTLLDTYGSSRAVREIHELICDTGMGHLTLEQIPTSCHQAPRPEVR